jgi:hypothetical protein
MIDLCCLQVSWLKRSSSGDSTPHLLTFGLTTYSNDARFAVFHEQPNDWKLQLQFPHLNDQGLYECLVSANPPIVKRNRLVVVGKQTLPIENVKQEKMARPVMNVK